MHPITYLIVNFGGPRTLQEVEPFLKALLTDKEVVRTRFPQVFHNFLFSKVAKKRAKVIGRDYDKIGGGSPIWADTEFVADALRPRLQAPVLTFHRYLPDTHKDFVEQIKEVESPEIRVFPMFPQFTYATTGSVAQFFWKHFFPAHPAKI